MSEEKAQKKKKKVDTLVKGLIIGGAIGSVLGVTLAPKSGKETRQIIKKSSTSLFEKLGKTGGDVVQTAKKTPVAKLLKASKTFIFGKKKDK